MYVRPKLAGLFAALVTSAALLLSGCSSSQPRDINYNTDVGVGFEPTDVASMSIDGAAGEASTSEAAAAVDTQISADSDDAMDIGVSADVPDDLDVAVLVDASIDGES